MALEALKTALLDLKAQLRGKRASEYIKKVEDAKPTPRAAKDGEEESRDSSDADVGGSEKVDKGDKKPEKTEAPLDFEEEMKNFMKKKNTGSSKGPTRVLNGAPETPKPKKKVSKT